MSASQAHRDGYDPETVAILQSALEDAWEALPPARRATLTRSEIAVRILKSASRGERDPVRLRTAAVTGILTRATPGGR